MEVSVDVGLVLCLLEGLFLLFYLVLELLYLKLLLVLPKLVLHLLDVEALIHV